MARFTVTTFGCQMNVHDSERLEEVLRRAGHEGSQREGDSSTFGRQDTASAYRDADVIVLNTCSVREKAEQKLRSEVGRLAKLKRKRPELVVVVAGCVAQQEGQRILDRFSAVDLVIGPDNIPELPELVAEIRLGGLPRVRTEFDLDAPHFLALSGSTGDGGGRVTAFVTTMKGCDERCSFCVVPYTRGPERYRPSSEILGEIRTLVASGVREVTLLGQTVNSYRDPESGLASAPDADPNDPDESEFAALLRAIAEEVPDLLRLRYTSPHPRHLTPSLIRAHAELGVLPHHVHLPVQSGSDRMLKRMIRRHTRDEYLERVERLRRALPGATVSTDIIVGFSGETEEDFAHTLSLMEQVGFVGVYAFMYSPRPYTPALKMGDDVPREVKAERLQRLFAVSERLFGEHLTSLVGSRQRVLVEGPGKAPGHWTGRSGRHEIVHIDGAGDLELGGGLWEVEIAEAFKHSLLGRLTVSERQRAAPRDRGQSRRLPLVGGA